MAMKINEGTQTSIYSELLSGTEIPKFKLSAGQWMGFGLFTYPVEITGIISSKAP